MSMTKIFKKIVLTEKPDRYSPFKISYLAHNPWVEGGNLLTYLHQVALVVVVTKDMLKFCVLALRLSTTWLHTML